MSVVARPAAPGSPPWAAPPDRGGLTLLAAGHFVIDMCVGALPAFLPVFTAIYALSDLAAAMILGASLLASSAIQPLFGLVADRRAAPAFLWGGVAVGAAGLAAAGLAGGYVGVLACIVGSGLGIAAFHPEAARVANRMAGDHKATGLAWFMVGGNAGFAAGPLVAAIFIPFLDERATLVFLVPGALVAAWLLSQRRRLAVGLPEAPAAGAGAARPGPSHVPGISLLLAVTTLRTWVQFGLLALVPLFLVEARDLSQGAAGFMVFAFSFAGAVGTVAGAALADRLGGRRMLVWSLPAATPAIAGFLLVGGPVGLALFALAGFVTMASFSVTVVMGQEYLPGRLALAAGLMIGFGAIGSAPPGLALFGAIADLAGRETAIWGLALLPLAAAAIATMLPDPRGPARARAAG
jgi:FSR family fosmidomycin resistance protein-like MFS transporter